MNIFKVGRYYIQMKGIVELNSYMSFLLTFFTYLCHYDVISTKEG